MADRDVVTLNETAPRLEVPQGTDRYRFPKTVQMNQGLNVDGDITAAAGLTIGGIRRTNWGTLVDSGVATAGGASFLDDTTKAWGVNALQSLLVKISGGTGAGQIRIIASNIATQLVPSTAWSTTPDSTSKYEIYASGISPNEFANVAGIAGMAALRAVTIVGGASYKLSYHTNPGDGGHGSFRGVTGAAPSTYVDDGGTIIVPAGGDGSAAYLRLGIGKEIESDWFGASSAADPTTALQSAITSANNGQTVLVSDGNYALTATLTSSKAIVLKGSGVNSCTLTLSADMDVIVITPAGNSRGTGVEKFTIASTGTTNTLITLTNAWKGYVEDCEFQVAGTFIKCTGNSFECDIINNRGFGASVYTIDIEATANGTSIRNNDLNGLTGYIGIRTAANSTNIINNWFETPSANVGGGHILQISGHMYVSGNSIGAVRTGGGDQISITGGSARIIGNQIAGGVAGSSSIAVNTGSAETVIIIGNKFPTSLGFFITATAGESVIVEGNTFDAASGAFTETSFITGAGEIKIDNNNFRMNSAANVYATSCTAVRTFNSNNIFRMGGTSAVVRSAIGNSISAVGSGATGLYAEECIGNYLVGLAVGLISRKTVVGNLISTCTTGITNTAGGSIAGNNFTGNTANLSGASGTFRGNTGLITENNGTAAILSGNTTIAVTHGLSLAPSLQDISVTPTNNMGAATKFWISGVTSTQFTINVDADPAASATFVWASARV